MGPQHFSEAYGMGGRLFEKLCSSLEGGELIILFRPYLRIGGRCTFCIMIVQESRKA